jgi:Fe-S oxidoreductase
MNDFANLCPSCGACESVCPFLMEYGTPNRILEEHPEASFFCTACGRCDLVCPRGFSPSTAFFDAKQRMVRLDEIPAPVRKTLAGARRFARAGHGLLFAHYQSADTVFWPGCGLAANRPGLVRRIQNILNSRLHKRVGLALDCCFEPVYGLGDKETAYSALHGIDNRLHDHGVRQVITACPNCHKLLSENLDEIQVFFILEVLPPDVFEKQQMESVYLHHPCPSSRWQTIRNRATEVVKSLDTNVRSNTIPDPLGAEESMAYCCGDGGGLSASDPSLANRFLEQITGAAAGRRIVTYCTGCQNRFLKQGVKALHLLECLSQVKPRRAIPSPFTQWVNRFFLALAARVETGKFVAELIIAFFVGHDSARNTYPPGA